MTRQDEGPQNTVQPVPVLFVVDADRQALARTESALLRRFGPDYERRNYERILSALRAAAGPDTTIAVMTYYNPSARPRRQRGAPHRMNDVDADQRRRTIPAVETAPLTPAATEGSHDRMSVARLSAA